MRRAPARQQYQALSCYGEHVGLAFQIVDDMLDVEESSEALGKTAGKDAQQHKITFPAVYGLERSRHMAEEECERAHAVLAPFGDRARAPARAGRPDRPSQDHEDRGSDRLIDLVERGLAESREKAQALIMAGEVRVNGQKATKPGHAVEDDCTLEVLSRPPYVSRGGFKLAAALRPFRIEVAGKVCLDIGSSTGGFTDCLLQRGAARVYAVDVRRRATRLEAAHRSARGSARRRSTRATLSLRRYRRAGRTLPCCDVSFISVTLILPARRALLRPGGQMVILIKPQFEVGKGQVGKGGIVRDPAIAPGGLRQSGTRPCASSGFETAIIESPIPGAEGNKEFLLYARH